MVDPRRNYTIELEHGAAVARVFRNGELTRLAVLVAARALLADARGLTRLPEVSGLLLDLRRLGGAVSPEIEDVYGEVAAAWERTGQPIAFLSLDPIQQLQVERIVSQSAPRMGAVFTDRNAARRYLGAASVNPDASSYDIAASLRGSKPE